MIGITGWRQCCTAGTGDLIIVFGILCQTAYFSVIVSSSGTGNRIARHLAAIGSCRSVFNKKAFVSIGNPPELNRRRCFVLQKCFPCKSYCLHKLRRGDSNKETNK